MVSSPFASPYRVSSWEHFVLVVLSRCPCLRGRDFSLKLSYFVFRLAFYHLFKFFVHFFFLLWIGDYVCCQCSHQGGDWGLERPRIGRWSLPSVMSDGQHGVDWLLAEYCRCMLRLDLRLCRWRAGTKGLSLAGPQKSGDTSRLRSKDPVAKRDQVRATWWHERQDRVMNRSWCRVVSHCQSLHAGFVEVHHKTVGLLGWATKPRPEAQRVETGSGCAKKFRCRVTCTGSGFASGRHGLQRRRDHLIKISKSWPYFPWGVCIFLYVLGVVWSFAQPRETSYI
jgi:hypothetical protein